MSELLDQLAASGHAHGLHFEQLNVLEEVEDAGYRRIPLDVRVVGRYSALRQWLDDWLGQVRLLRAGDMSMSAAEGRPGLLRLRLRVQAYHADVPDPAPAWLAQLPSRAELGPPLVDPFSAWTARVSRGDLAKIPLTQLEMVGSLSRGSEHEALLLSAGRLFRLRPGDRVGRDEGVVVLIDERQVEVRERLFLGGGWRERTMFLTLRKRVEGEVKEDDEMDSDRGVGPAVDPPGVGDALPG